MIEEKKKNKLIHLATIKKKEKGAVYLFLQELSPHQYAWFEEGSNDKFQETLIQAESIEEALRLAAREWKHHSYRTVNCGFRYTLPERDEHGINALFYQMVASYSSINGVYFDEGSGCNCIVLNASLESRRLMHYLQKKGRL